MSQVIWSTIDPNTTSGTQLATYLNDFKSAVVSGFSGTSRPTNLQAYGYWVDTTNIGSSLVSFMFYDGTNDIEIFQINLATQGTIISGSESIFEILKISDDSVGPILKLEKQRVTGGGQTLDGDVVGDIEFKANDSSPTDYVVSRIRSAVTDDVTAAAQGSYIAISTTPDAEASLSEAVRITGDNKLGVGTTAPDTTIHSSATDSTAGVKSSIIIDSTDGPKVILNKQRVSGSGQVLSGDTIGTTSFTSTDQNGAEIEVAKVTASANENHTDAAQGTDVIISSKKTGATAFTDSIKIENAGITLTDDVTITGNLQVDGTETILNVATVDSEDKNITLNKNGNDATSEGGGLTIERTSTDGSFIYADAVTSKFKIGALGSEVEVADVSSSQQFSNKDYDGGTASNTSRLTVPKAAKATLDGLTRKEATIVYASDQNKLYADDGTNLLPIGSGVGSVSIYGLLDAEDSDVSTWTNDGTASVAINATTPIAGDRDYKVTVTGTTQWVRTPAQSLDPRSNYANTTHAIKGVFKITGTAGAEWIIRALDQSNAQVGTDLLLEYTDGSPKSFELLFNVSSSETSIKLEIECNSFTAGDLFYIDDIVFDDDPLSFNNVRHVQYVKYSGGNGEGSTDTNVRKFDTETTPYNSGVFSTNHASYGTAGLEVTFLKDCHVSVSYSDYAATSSNRIAISLNAPGTTAVSSLGTVQTLASASIDRATTSDNQSCSWSGRVSAGDVIRPHVENSNLEDSSSAQFVSFSIFAEADADHVIRSGESDSQLNRWSGYTSSSTFGSETLVRFTSESYNKDGNGDDNDVYILAVDTGSYTKFTATQDCYFDVHGYLGANGTAMSVRIYRYNAAGTKQEEIIKGAQEDNAAYFIGNEVSAPIQMNGGDFVSIGRDGTDTTPITGWVSIKATPRKAKTLYALPTGDENHFAADIANNGTASITSKSADFIQSVNRSALGVVDIVYKSGFFTTNPIVTSNISSSANAGSHVISDTSAGCTIETWTSSTGALVDSDFTIQLERQGADRGTQQVFLGNVPAKRVMYIDTHASSYNAAVTATTAYKTRPLVSLSNDIFGSIGSNQLTLPIGKYEVTTGIGAYGSCQNVHLLIYNITDAANIEEFVEVVYNNSTASVTFNTVQMTFEIAAQKTIEFQTKSDIASGEEYISRIKVEKIG